MRHQEMDLDRFSRFYELLTETPDAGPRVNDNGVPVIQAQLQAGGIAAIANGVFPRNGN